MDLRKSHRSARNTTRSHRAHHSHAVPQLVSRPSFTRHPGSSITSEHDGPSGLYDTHTLTLLISTFARAGPVGAFVAWVFLFGLPTHLELLNPHALTTRRFEGERTNEQTATHQHPVCSVSRSLSRLDRKASSQMREAPSHPLTPMRPFSGMSRA